MLKIWSKLCRLGTSEQNNDSLNRRIALSNRLGMIFTLLAMAVLPVFVFGMHDLVGSIATALAIFIAAGTLFLNSKGHITSSRVLVSTYLVVASIVVPLLAKIVDLSQRDVTHYYTPRILTIVALLVPFFLFDLSKKKHQIIFALVAIATYLSFDPVHYLAGVGIDQVELTFTNYYFMNVMGTLCLLIALFGLFFLSRSNKNYELELIEAKNKAERALEIKGDFLSLMSHEIRTPLNAVIGMANLLIQEDPRDDQKEKIDVLKYSGKTLLSLINDILDYNKMESGNIELEKVLCQLPQTLGGIHQTYLTQATQKGIELQLDIDPNLPRNVMTDEGRLKQILTNLVGNAIKFTSEGTVCMGAYVMGLNDKNMRVTFTVSDTGIGIKPEQQEFIFDSFRQASSSTTRSFGGTGLGLAISKNLSQLFGGDLEVTSEEGVGSVFYFTIEMELASPEEIFTADDQTEHDLNLTGYRFLIAEDNELNILVARGFFEKWGAHVTIARNGEEAVDWMRSGDFDMIFMDLHMPKMDGIEATKNIRAFNTNIPIIALTASAMLKEKHEVFNCGMNEIVAKPFDPIDLNQKIKIFLS